MNKLYYILLSVFFISSAHTAMAQESAADETTKEAKGVVIYSDPRLAIVLKKHKASVAQQGPGTIRSGKGFRVQIYNGNDRNKANSIKIDFMHRFPGIHTYLTYVSPQFRVKVGDYTNRQDAQKMYHDVSEIYSPSMIVPDYIVISSVKTSE
jgi:SPOR domain